jgi:hypothetical protein
VKKRSEYYYYSDGLEFKGISPQEVFRSIFKKGKWKLEKDQKSDSGVGSEIEQTRTLLEELPGILKKFNITVFLDIPCGDFNWLNRLEWKNTNYIGGDIVKEIIDQNQKQYWNFKNLHFKHINILNDPLPEADLLFCRDCLVHFSYYDIDVAMRNIKQSNIKYFMTTTFNDEANNEDIVTGGWRPINLTRPPFDFPDPVLILNEHCTEADGLFKDKSMGLWLVDEL